MKNLIHRYLPETIQSRKNAVNRKYVCTMDNKTKREKKVGSIISTAKVNRWKYYEHPKKT